MCGIDATALRAHVHRLLRLHDGRAQVAWEWLTQLRHGRRRPRSQFDIVLRQQVQVLGLGDAIDVVQLGRRVALAPVRLQRPEGRTQHHGR